MREATLSRAEDPTVSLSILNSPMRPQTKP